MRQKNSPANENFTFCLLFSILKDNLRSLTNSWRCKIVPRYEENFVGGKICSKFTARYKNEKSTRICIENLGRAFITRDICTWWKHDDEEQFFIRVKFFFSFFRNNFYYFRVFRIYDEKFYYFWRCAAYTNTKGVEEKKKTQKKLYSSS